MEVVVAVEEEEEGETCEGTVMMEVVWDANSFQVPGVCVGERERETVSVRVLQCVAVRCSVLQWGCMGREFVSRPSYVCVRERRGLCVCVCCSVLQCVAVCCSVLYCVAVCCSVLQRVAVCLHETRICFKFQVCV